MNYQDLISKVEATVKQQFTAWLLTNKLSYHNLKHTARVAKAARQIANHYQLSDHDFFVVITAAWFHDTGYYVENGDDHETKGAALAGIFLKDTGVDDPTISEVKNCILATKIPQQPHTLNEEIVCDADLCHLGTEDFSDTDKLIRKEFEGKANKEVGKKEWRAGAIQFLQAHHYHTDYCQLLLNEKKQQNIDKVIKKQQEKDVEQSAIVTATVTPKKVTLKDSSKEKKTGKPVRGIETIFRVASANHQRLSDMADSKAHIMISRIVDRYLEHGRIFIFNNGVAEKIFLGSADWMNRNIYRRIEVCFPLYDPLLKAEILAIIHLQLQDNVQAVKITTALDNEPVQNNETLVQSQPDIYHFLNQQ